MKYILGLDAGTNSLGWYLLKLENAFYEIIDGGVVIFPIGTNVDPVKGLEKTKNAQRRGFRAASRNRFRKRLRKRQLEKLLKQSGFKPDRTGNLAFTKTYKQKGLQSLELYKLRAEALDKKIEDKKDLGLLFTLLNSYRGFKSSSKSVADEVDGKKDREGEVKGGIEQLSQLIQKADARTYGEYFYKMHLKAKELYEQGKWHNANEPYDERALDEKGRLILPKSYGIRREYGRYTARAQYENEFDLIWRKQKEFYSELLTGSKEEYDDLKKILVHLSKEERRSALASFKETLYWQIKYGCIYYQRPLKSPKRYIGHCSLEPSKRGAPVSSFLFQSFRIWKQLADVRYSNEGKSVYKEPLSLEWKKSIFDYLQTNPVVYLKSGKNKTGICQLLDLDEKTIRFNFDNEENDKYIKGNTTTTTLYNVLGNDLFYAYQNAKDNKGISKLEKLWHLLYMKKDNEWLRLTLHDTQNWNELTENHIESFVESAFEEGYAAYSTKALRKIIPFMETGDDERTALEKARHREKDETFDEATWQPAKKVAPIKSGELRNPVVEKAASETIKLVNAILKQYPEISRREWEIHIETTRDLKKPKNERERMRRESRYTDETREEYARFLNNERKEGKLQGILKRDVFKNDPIINKLELWLEMGGDKNDPEFEAFSKIANLNEEKRLKHRLWLECNRICPYTEKVISLTDLFSPAVEIEHIVPLSRSLDNSFTNKTLTYHSVNKQKGARTAYQFLEHDIRGFEKRLSKAFFSDAKMKNFLQKDVPQNFTHAQISNTAYIARFIRQKLQAVCKPHFIYFTNGKATAELRNHDWRLGDLLDKIRYEEAIGVDIDETLRRFGAVRKDFHQYYKSLHGPDCRLPKSAKDFDMVEERIIADYDKKTGNNLLDVLTSIKGYNAFRSEKGRKDRTDHRHHAIDACITALCSPSITKALSDYNRIREERGESLYNEYGELSREKIDRPFKYDDLKDSLKNILVVNKTEQRLLVTKNNKIKTKNGVIIQKSKSIRASLHKDTYYGKLKNPANHKIDKPAAYVTRFNNYVWEFDDENKLDAIYDPDVREILRRRILKFKANGISITPDAYYNNPLYKYSVYEYPSGEPENPVNKFGGPLPVIKKVRTVYKNYRSIIPLPHNKYADADGNYLMALYELKERDKKGNLKATREFKLLSSFAAVEKKRRGEKLFADEIEKNGKVLSLMQECPFLVIGDLVIMYESEEDKKMIDWNDNDDLKKRLYVTSQLGSSVKKTGGKDYLFGNVRFVKHNVSKNNAVYKGMLFSVDQKAPFIENYHTQLNVIKVYLNETGSIIKR